MANFKHAIKPCRVLSYCPYGPLVEEMPLPNNVPMTLKTKQLLMTASRGPNQLLRSHKKHRSDKIW